MYAFSLKVLSNLYLKDLTSSISFSKDFSLSVFYSSPENKSTTFGFLTFCLLML